MQSKRFAYFAAIFAATSLFLVLLAQQAFTPSGQFLAGSPLAAARQGAASTVLADGRVLVTGGQDATGPLSSAEFIAGTSAGTMATPRYRHIAVALNDGRVLVAGGRTTGDAVTNAAEIFTSGSWTPISSMLVARAGATATLLSDGRVFIVGGEGSGGALQTTEIFDPASGQFTNGAPLSTVRKNHAATLLNDGRVLIAGGSDGANALASIEIFDPKTGAISTAGAMSAGREGLSATTLVRGTVLLAGGSAAGNARASTELFDPTTGTVAAGPSMSAARSGHLALLLPNNNTVLMAGGSSSAAGTEIYVSWTNAFAAFGSLSSARTSMTGGASVQNSSAAVAGGLDASGVSAAVDVVRFPTVKTDKPDYSPGETATITGTGFAPSETVKVVIEEVVDIDNDSPITLNPAPVADAGGNFSVTFPVNAADAHITFYLSATGQASGLTAGMTFTDNPAVHFVTASFVARVSTCSPAIVIQTPGDLSEPVSLSSSSVTGTFYSDATCTTSITSVITSATHPPRATFYYKDSTVGTPTITVTDTGSAGEKAGTQVETISSTAIATTTSVVVSPTSATVGVSTTVTVTATLTRNDTSGILANATIDFIVNGVDLGTATTNTSGQASRSFDPTSFPNDAPPPPTVSLGVGSYPVVAEFSGGTISSNLYAGSTGNGTFTVSSPATVAVTVDTAPTGLSISVDGGGTLTAPQTFNWTPSSNHTITTTSPQSGGTGKQYVFTSWSDAGAISHSITVPASATTYTASFKTQWQVTFKQTGISSDAGTDTILTLAGPTNYNFSQFDITQWVDNGAGITYTYAATVGGGTGKQYVLTSTTPSTLSSVTTATTVTGAYKTQWQVTFHQAGVGVDAGTNTVLTLTAGPTNYTQGQFDVTQWVDNSASISFTWAPTVATSVTGKQYALVSSSATSPLTVTAAVTVTGTYKTQWQVTFHQTGVNSDAGTSTVLTLTAGPANYNQSQFDVTQWVDDSGSISFTWAPTVATSVTGKQYALVSSSATSPLTVTAAVTVTGTYKTQWQVTFHQTGVGVDAGSNTVLALTAGPTNYNQSQFDVTQWADNNGSISFTWAPTVATSVTGKQYALVSSSATSPLTVTAAVTVTGTYKTQWQVAFTQSGIGADTGTNQVLSLSVNGNPANTYNAGNLPGATFYDDGTSLAYSYSSPVATSSPNKQYVLTSTTPSSPYVVHAVQTVTGAYKTQWQVTFHQTGVGVDAGTNTVLTLTAGPTNYNQGQFDVTQWVDDNVSIAFTWAPTVTTSVTGKQYAFVSSSAASPLTVTAAVTVTGTYKTQWQVTFHQTGVGVDAGTNTVLTLTAGPTGYNQGQFEVTQWVDNNGSIAFTWAPTVATSVTGKQYALASSSATSPLTVTAAVTVTGTYKTQWQVTFHQTGVSSDAGSNTILTLAGSMAYTFSQFDVTQWVDNTGSIAFTWAPTVATSVTGKQYALVSSSATSPLTVTAAATVTGTYKTQYQVTFTQTGIGADTGTNQVLSLSINGNPANTYNAGNLPAAFYDSGTSLAYTYSSPVGASGDPNKQYVLTSASPNPSPASPINSLGAPTTVTAAYKSQYKVTFTQTGIGGDTGMNQVLSLSINGNPASAYSAGNLPGATFYDAGTSFVYTYSSPVATSDPNKQYVLTSTAPNPSPASPISSLSAPMTVTGAYKTQYKVTFTQTGIGGDTGTNAVLALSVGGGGSTNYDASHLTTPSTWYDSGTILTYTYSGNVDTSPASTKRYRLTGTSPGSPYTVSAAQTINGTYVIQWQVTFQQSGISPDAGSSTILTLAGPTNYALVAFSVNQWVDNNGGISYTYASMVAATTGKQYALTSVAPPSLANVTAPTTVTGTYKTQYYLTITTNPAAVGRTNVSPTADGWYDTGTNVALTATTPVIVGSTSFTFNTWSGSVTVSTNPTSVTMNAPRNVTANYDTWVLAWDAGSAFSAQYSDPTGLKVDLSFNGAPIAAIGIHFSVGIDASSPDPTTNALGVATDTTNLTQAPGSSYTATAVCGACGGLTITNPYTITKEDARVTYTGPLFASTSSSSSSLFNVVLAATIQDITAFNPALSPPNPDNYPGDIRKAVARFVDRGNANATICTAPIGLVNPGDLKTGTISCSFSGDVGTQSSAQYTVGIIVDDYLAQKSYYIRNASTDDQVVTISQAMPGMITGGGFLQMFTPTQSAGQYPGDAGLKTNFGFNVKYNKTGKSLQGNLNFIIRSGGKVYQIKANSMTTLGILQGTSAGCTTATTTSPCQATFTSKANLTDITNETSPIALGGNLNMIVTMTDKGEPGSSDTFGITLYDSSNNILFSSNWNGTTTLEQSLGGGNVVVH